ncbi:hypothetical protein LGT39_10435 [Demequina sp. TTPB684]|uniref:hypothetical protein n=1 Tax=unclassified Demequina TaxID=2620311 RepID=UPI001CF533C2|nr:MULTISPECIES: hypothetical protein [unclassified Demequina]MCB2413259.1 hypothetical protein [Demequina sp. TTPB684]UPU88719.1 hypothetical protein LGT36_002005 [Demequina sp. TMPB413]
MDMASASAAVPGLSASHGASAVGAGCSLALLALVTGCGSGNSQVLVENHCDVPIEATFTYLVSEVRQPEDRLFLDLELDADGALDIAAGESLTLVIGPHPSPDTHFEGKVSLTIRGEGGEWLEVALMEEAPTGSDVGYLKDGVFVVDGVLCSQLDDRVSGSE